MKKAKRAAERKTFASAPKPSWRREKKVNSTSKHKSVFQQSSEFVETWTNRPEKKYEKSLAKSAHLQIYWLIVLIFCTTIRRLFENSTRKSISRWFCDKKSGRNKQETHKLQLNSMIATFALFREPLNWRISQRRTQRSRSDDRGHRMIMKMEMKIMMWWFRRKSENEPVEEPSSFTIRRRRRIIVKQIKTSHWNSAREKTLSKPNT